MPNDNTADVSIRATIDTGSTTDLIGTDRQIFIEDVVGDLSRLYGLVVFNACLDYYSITNDRNVKSFGRSELVDEFLDRFMSYDLSEALRKSDNHLDIEHARAILAVASMELMRETYTATTYLIDDLRDDFADEYGEDILPNIIVTEMSRADYDRHNDFRYDIVIKVTAQPYGKNRRSVFGADLDGDTVGAMESITNYLER